MPSGNFPVLHPAWIVAVYCIYALEKTIRLRETQAAAPPGAAPPEKSPGE